MSPNNTKSLTRQIRQMVDDLQKYSIITYPNDHPPAHVHIEQAEKLAIIELVPEVRVRSNRGFKQPELNEIEEICFYFREFLLDKWDELHRRRM